LRELDALSYGSLLHRVVEQFYRANGAAFVAREKTLGAWRKIAFEVADRVFDEFLSEYPLVGEGIREKERARLRRSVEAFIEYDWNGSRQRRYVGVELPFGEEKPLAIAADGATLHVRGFIDRVDVEEGAALVRDLKSGRSHPRRGKEADPEPVLDVQLGLYQVAAKKLAAIWKTPKNVVAAYAYASGRGDVEERAYREDPDVLEKATKEWLATAAHLLEEHAFAPTPDEKNCKYCPFRVVCGAGAPRRAAEGLEEAEDGGALARFRALELGEGEDE
jgi:ATP-dependent helicase/DNAse subunit B